MNKCSYEKISGSWVRSVMLQANNPFGQMVHIFIEIVTVIIIKAVYG